MRFIPITYIDRRASSAKRVIALVEQLLILFFESYHAGLHVEWVRTEGAAEKLSHAWSTALTEVLLRVTRTTKNSNRFTAFRLPQSIEGCNWGSPLLENPWADSKLWTRTTLFNSATGRPEKYQFRGPVRIVRKKNKSDFSFCLRIITTNAADNHRPTSFRVYPVKADCPGLKADMEVNIVVEIMIPHNGRHPRHPTPFYPVPDIGPFDMYSDVAAMAIRIEWQKDDGQWISRPLTLTRTKLASSATGTGITTTKFGPEVEYMTMAWLRCVKFMGSLMQWEWQSKKPFVQLMVRYPGRVRCIETDFLGQKYVVSIADKIKRPEPKLLDLEQTAALLRKRYGSENMMIGLPPKKGWWAVPGEDMRGLINRTRCDMCVFVSSGVSTFCMIN